MKFYNYHGVKFCALILCSFEVDQIYFTFKESFMSKLDCQVWCATKRKDRIEVSILRPKLDNEKFIRMIESEWNEKVNKTGFSITSVL